MTREEFGIIVKALKAVYSTPSFIPDQDAFNVWYELLKDIDYQTATKAVQSYMTTESKLPTIADIRNKAMQFNQSEQLNELEAWSLVSKALSNGYYGANEEYKKLPPLVQKAVGDPANIREWSQLDFKALSVIQSNFERVYRAVAKREDEVSRMPSQIRQLIQENEPKIMIENNSTKVLEDKQKNYGPMPDKVKARFEKLKG